jgi:hypothetical protein
MNTSGIRGFFLGVIVVTSSLSVLAMTIPKTFIAGQPIKASDVNLNFDAVKIAVTTLENKALRFGTVATGVNATSSLKLTNTNGDGLVSNTTAAGTAVKGVGGYQGGYFEATTPITPGRSPSGVVGVNRVGGSGVKGISTSGSGVFGISVSSQARVPGVLGVNNSATGQVVGVLGQATLSPIGTGINGIGSVAGGYFEATGGPSGGFNPVGIAAVAKRVGGVGVSGLGSYRGVEGRGGDVAVSAINESGGYLYLGSNSSGAVFEVLYDGTVRGKAFTVLSDRNAKTNFSSVNALTVLEKVTHLPIQRWNYKDDASSLQHVGPMAQDFHAAFSLNGSDDKHISTVDVQGVALAAIQGLNQKLETENADLRAKLANLETRLLALERK